MTALTLNTDAVKAAALENILREALVGHDPGIIGVALGMVTATYLVGLPPRMRQETRNNVVQLIDDLVPIVLAEMIATGRVPADWKEPDQ